MLIKSEATLKNIQQLSLSLSTSQLDQFVTVIESLAQLLEVANADTQKAYQMYLNSIESPKEGLQMKSHIMPMHYGTTNVVPFKH